MGNYNTKLQKKKEKKEASLHIESVREASNFYKFSCV